jgi:hypothetical protein
MSFFIVLLSKAPYPSKRGGGNPGDNNVGNPKIKAQLYVFTKSVTKLNSVKCVGVLYRFPIQMCSNPPFL